VAAGADELAHVPASTVVEDQHAAEQLQHGPEGADLRGPHGRARATCGRA
jgi:hypothetical protein